MAKTDNLTDFLTDIADAIREKKGTADKINPQDFASEIANLTSGGSGEWLSEDAEKLISRTLTAVKSENVTSIGEYAFRGCSNLEEVYLPNVTKVAGSAFYSCSKIKELSLPKCTSSGTYSFASMGGLEVLDLPLVTDTGSNGIRTNTKMVTVNLAKCTRVNTNGLAENSALIRLDLPVCATINATGFSGCSSLEILILRKSDKAVSLGNTSAFNNTPIANGTGYVYVPAALVESYKSATNWSTYASQIRAIEDYPEITGI